MNKIIFGLVVFIFGICNAQVLPHYNGAAATGARDEINPFILKIADRLDTAFITNEQRNDGDKILRQTKKKFNQCEETFGQHPSMIGGLKGCLGRYTGVAMSQIGLMELISRQNLSMNKSQQKYSNYHSDSISSNEKHSNRNY